MKVKELMSRDIATCTAGDSAATAARLMWENDCGLIPIVDAESQTLEGVVTDRDLCMAGLIQGTTLDRIPLTTCMQATVESVRTEQDVKTAHAAMRDHQVRRLPVLDRKKRVVGVLSLSDLVLDAQAGRPVAAKRNEILKTLGAIATPTEVEESVEESAEVAAQED